MNWKRYLIIFVNLFLIFFPYNILGCADGVDPYDYFISFFQNDLPAEKSLSPFYYTNYRFLYNDNEPIDVAQATSAEWITYCGGKIEKRQAYQFVCQFAYKDLSSVYYHLEKNQPLKIPDSVRTNGMTAYFLNNKDLEALGYLMYAKQVEPFVTGNWNDWETPLRDSAKMGRLIQGGLQLYAAATKDFIKLRLAYQLLRLSHYSGHYEDCMKWYDQLVQSNATQSVLHDLSVSLNAGALCHLGKKNEAAYIFSKQFAKSDVKKVANYMSFSRCVNRFSEKERKQCLDLCKNNEEKANLLGLFALGSNVVELNTLKEVARLSPQASILEMLAVREVNKIEDNYLSPALKKEKGGAKIYYSWPAENVTGNLQEWDNEPKELSSFFHTMASGTAVKNQPLYEIIAAYLAYVARNYTDAKKYLSNASALHLTGSLKDQWAITSLLVTMNEKDTIDGAFEEQLLPSLQWLESKAKSEKNGHANEFDANNQWQKFYRNVFLEILAKRYHRQGDIHKEALCVGNAFLGEDYIAKEFVRNEMETKDILLLNELLSVAKKNKWEQFLCKNFPLKKDEVTDVIGMTHTRDFNFVEAIEWLTKVKDPTVLQLQHNPFGSLLKDNQDSVYSFDKGKFDKLSFLKEMNSLEEKEKQGTTSATELFKSATGYYNMTYYGRAWQMVKYGRSGAEGYYIPKNATAFQKEYYGCFTAETYFKKAMNASTDPDFKSRCLFMIAKCSQKQVPRPQYQDFSNNYPAMELAEKKYLLLFKYNKYFPQLVKDYGNTQFYKQAFNTCSYLKDFVRQNKSSK